MPLKRYGISWSAIGDCHGDCIGVRAWGYVLIGRDLPVNAVALYNTGPVGIGAVGRIKAAGVVAVTPDGGMP